MLKRFCTKCGEEKPATAEYFYRAKRGKYGLEAQCKVCHSKYIAENREMVRERKRRWNEDNKERYKAYHKEYREKNRERMSELDRKWRENNKERCLKNSRDYYAKNKEHIKQKRREWCEANKDKIKGYRRKFKQSEKGKYAAIIKTQKRRAMEKKVQSDYCLELWNLTKDAFNNTCAYCGKEDKLEQEHFIALSKGGEYTKNNIIPACKICNSSKRDHDFFEWYPKYKYYSKRRETFILKYLNYHGRSQQLSI